MGRQEWMKEVARDRIVLEQILVLLLSLAALADRAAGAPFAVRLRVLEFLGHGEAAARGLLVAMADRSFAGAMADSAEVPPPEAYLTVDDAARLAATLRVLALGLSVILAQAGRREPREEAGSPEGSSLCQPVEPHVCRASTELPAPDTS